MSDYCGVSSSLEDFKRRSNKFIPNKVHPSIRRRMDVHPDSLEEAGQYINQPASHAHASVEPIHKEGKKEEKLTSRDKT